jgi:hypothetical protein
MPDAGSTSDINVRSDSYWIARALGECRRCRAATRFVALALPPRHQSLTLDWDVQNDEFLSYRWEAAESSAFLFYIEYLSEDASRRLQAAAPSYRFALCERTHGWYWANHCASCARRRTIMISFASPVGPFSPRARQVPPRSCSCASRGCSRPALLATHASPSFSDPWSGADRRWRSIF